MSAALAAAALVVLFLAAALWADALPGRRQLLPPALLAALCFLVFLELARYDHGYREVLYKIGVLGAPIVLIFAASAWGTRRFYGWPDFGPQPGRAALVCVAILAGVYIGTAFHDQDVEATKVRGNAIAREVRNWRDAHEGRWPAKLEDAVDPVESTRMGGWASPPFTYERTEKGAVLSFPASSRMRLELDLDGDGWRSVKR